jgi:hypothetical protein
MIESTNTYHFRLHLHKEEIKHEPSVTYSRYPEGAYDPKYSARYATIEEWLNSIADCLEMLPEGRRNVLLYIHGLWEDNPLFVSYSNQILHKELFNQDSHPFGMIISMQWEGKLWYEENLKLVERAGKYFCQIAVQLKSQLSEGQVGPRFAFLCHSMGNNIFRYMWQCWTEQGIAFKISRVFLCAADLPDDVFENDLKNLTQYCHKTIVLYHQKDKTLTIAQLLKPFPRMGILGPARQSSLPQNITCLDVTQSTEDDHSIGGAITHHQYFYGSKFVTALIRKVLEESASE